jgi:hypothetical protein
VGFVAAGDFGLLSPVSGVAVSTDAGITFTAYSANLQTDARYVAAPSTTTMYLSAGNWPESNNDDTSSSSNDPFSNDNFNKDGEVTKFVPRTSRFGVAQRGGRLVPQLRTGPAPYGNSSEFMVQLSKSTDGGKTWTSLFLQENTWYGNGITCWDEEHCCVVGEADAGNVPGSRIWCTQNGTVFTQTLFNSGAEYSLIDIAAVPGSTGEAWAVGGNMETNTALFYHTTNYGASWNQNGSIAGQYASSVDCVDSTHCWSTLLDVTTQEASVAGLS